MDFSFADLEQLVRTSGELSESEIREFIRALGFLTDSQQRLIFELFSGEPDLVRFMYDNFKKKKDNLHDPGAWEKIVKEEMDFLNNR
jgi:hypothetical protein